MDMSDSEWGKHTNLCNISLLWYVEITLEIIAFFL